MHRYWQVKRLLLNGILSFPERVSRYDQNIFPTKLNSFVFERLTALSLNEREVRTDRASEKNVNLLYIGTYGECDCSNSVTSFSASSNSYKRLRPSI